MIIVLGGQKGGVGKTTIACNLAVALSKQSSVLLIDADNQKTVSNWNTYRKTYVNKNNVDFTYENLNLIEATDYFKNDYEYLIIDTSGRDSENLRKATLIANIFLIPITPTAPDLLTAKYLNTNVLPNLNKVNKKIKTFVLLNQISTHALDKDQHFAREYLKQLKYLNVLKSGLKNRKSYHRNFFNGYSVFENKCKKSKLEIENLTEELLNE